MTLGTYAGIVLDLLTLVANFKPGMGGMDCFCTFVARSLGKDLWDLFCRHYIGDGAGNTADRYDRYCEMIFIA